MGYLDNCERRRYPGASCTDTLYLEYLSDQGMRRAERHRAMLAARRRMRRESGCMDQDYLEELKKQWGQKDG